ncbi:MAG: radical SAM protein [Deltaproteobacteria bacterium]|nr:radical SAM protein [Deltaproteobacteria bacterium]
MTICAPCSPTRESTAHVYYGATKSLCTVCKRQIDAKTLIRGGQVFLEKYCPEHGKSEAFVSSSAEWYLDALSFVAPSIAPKTVHKKVTHGCPHDCGPCDSHAQKVFLPVVPITSACNLDCPICYTINKNEDPFHLSKEHFAKILEHLRRDHEELDIINFTGGEPTVHPRMIELLEMARDAGIRRLTVSTNGLKLLDEGYVEKLAAVDARVILSLDTFDPAVDKAMLGANTIAAKMKVLDLCEKHDVTCTILPAVAAGMNDKDVPALFDLVLSRRNVCSLELHTLTFTGENGSTYDRAAKITTPDLHEILRAHTGDSLSPMDFVPSPLAHPHCYSIAYVLVLDGPSQRGSSAPDFVPFVRLMGRAKLFELLQDSLYLEPTAKVEEEFRAVIDRLWADPDALPESDRVLATMKRVLRDVFPQGETLSLEERRKRAERVTKAIYIHSHMDEENFDVSRIMKCCVGVPEADGSNIPTCSYNILYREKDRRFATESQTELMAEKRRRLPLAK